MKVVERLQQKYGDLYADDNVMLSATHTHSGPAGFSMYLLYDLNSWGFIQAHFDAIVDGIFKAIVRAHDRVEDAQVLFNRGQLDDSNINRSPTSYLRNPEAERQKYDWNTDHEMNLLRINSASGAEVGMINWFGVHGTSMNSSNHLISGDNKGYASYLFEQLKNGKGVLPGKGSFIAAFGSTNEGDMSPNTKGPSCPDGSPCDDAHSTCQGRAQGCTAKGPGADMFQSTEKIGHNQYMKAVELYGTAAEELSAGDIDYRFAFVDFNTLEVDAAFTSTGKNEKTCRPALGYSFAAGTTDGPGDFTFTQNDTSTNPFWKFVSGFVAVPTAEQVACQAPKPILLDVGDTKPSPWAPNVMPIQIFKLGKLYLLAVPGEFTTMSGRRLKDAVRKTLLDNGAPADIKVVIAGLSNSYCHYVTTFEEFQHQRYEGASTLYGPHELAGFMQEFSRLAKAMATGQAVERGPSPADLSKLKLWDFQPPVILDTPPFFKSFGTVDLQPSAHYTPGQTVQVVFWGANPRNDYMTETGYLTVERLNPTTNQWEVQYDDGSWETKMTWQRDGISSSKIHIDFLITFDVAPGTWRITHSGFYKVPILGVKPYHGVSNTFEITATQNPFYMSYF
eukprot:GILJ01000918.1.p1 GENE.GILJ01000918.1~~GILJ01000918.1.p1  ORF type:complete len:722 (+),score=110.05 GILJ01000918.1:313-2166(+)